VRIAILGNSGSGKSTLAKALSVGSGAMILDLDTVAWEPGLAAVARGSDVAEREVGAFCETHLNWIVEGCYAYLIDVALRYQQRLIFLNPGAEACVAHCRSRPWEPHKYASMEEQDARLQLLLPWVREYYSRDGDMSLQAHLECYHAYGGPKEERRQGADVEAASAHHDTGRLTR
jgi:adenylate kinase family enzyme